LNKEEPLVSSFDLGKVFWETCLIHDSCDFACNTTEENFIGNDLETLVSERYLNSRLNRSSKHLIIKPSLAIHSQLKLVNPSPSVNALNLLAVV
jgi:hypothetical protein